MNVTSSGDAQRSLDSFELIRRNERRMRNKCCISLTLLQESHTIFGSPTVTNGTNLLSTVFLLELLDHCLGDLITFRGGMVSHPLHEIESGLWVEAHGITMEHVWNDDKVPIGSKLVGNKLDVEEGMADDVGTMQAC